MTTLSETGKLTMYFVLVMFGEEHYKCFGDGLEMTASSKTGEFLSILFW